MDTYRQYNEKLFALECHSSFVLDDMVKGLFGC